MKQRVRAVLAAAVLLLGLLAGGSQPTWATPQSEPAAAPQRQVTIKFYGPDADYNKNIVAGFQATHPNIKVEIVPIDFGNAEQIIKTGIVSGRPVDVSFFWGTAISLFTDASMALDLTPYLEANNGEWKNTFVQSYLDGSKINGRYYAVPYNPILETMFYNKDLLARYGRTPPKTWAEFLQLAEILKKDGIYAMGCQNNFHHQMLNYAYQYMLDAGLDMDEVAAGNVSFTANPGFRENLTMIKDAYERGYWYPGEGALTTSPDEVRAAFYQGKVAMIYVASSQLKEYADNADFAVGAMRQPLIHGNARFAINVLTNALFIPHNAVHVEEAIAFMKYYTSPEGQKETVATWRPEATKGMAVTIPELAEISALTEGDVFGYTQINNISPEINSYLQREMVSSVCTGVSVEAAVQKLEALRLEAIGRR